MGRRFCVLSSSIIIVAIISLSAEPRAGAYPKVRVGLPDFTSSSVPFEIARRMGYFSQEGLDVDIIRMSCAVSVRALVAKSIDFDSCAGVKAAVSAVSQGIQIKIVMARFHRPLMDLIGDKEVQRISDLSGKVIGNASGSGDLRFQLRSGRQPRRCAEIICKHGQNWGCRSQGIYSERK